MQFRVLDIEFDFDDEFGPYPDDEKEGLVNQTITTIWEADDEDDLLDEITSATGWCVKSIVLVNLVK